MSDPAKPKFTHLRRRIASGQTAAPLCLVALVLTTSCFQGARAPSVSPSGTLRLNQSDPAQLLPKDQPFGVVFGAPHGETDDAPEISLVFNRPMRPLDLAGQEAKAPVKMSPQVRGSWRWVGTNALIFSPETALPNATNFEIEVAAGTKALDGSALEKPYKLAFSTPRPKWLGATTAESESHLLPTATFKLRFNQPIDTQEIQRAFSLLGKKERIAFAIKRPDPQNLKLAELVPQKPLPLGSEIQITADDKLHGMEGPLTSNKAETHTFNTYGTLSVGELSCSRSTPHGKCAPHSPISFGLTNAVKRKDLRAAITITPAIKLDGWDSGEGDQKTSYANLNAAFGPARSYTVRIKAGLRDIYGQQLARDVVMQVPFDDLWPEAKIGVSGTYFEPKAARDVAVASVNVTSLDLATVALDEQAVADIEWNASTFNFDRYAALKGAKSSRLHPAAAPNLTAKQVIHLPEVLANGQGRGPVAIAIAYTARPGSREARVVHQAQVVQVTDLGISAKVSRFGSVIWVTSLATGQPVSGAEVRIRRPSTPSDVVLKTDGNGMANVDGDIIRPTHDEKHGALIIVKNGADWAYRNSANLFYSWRYGVQSELSGNLPTFGMLFTERGLYRPGDTVRLKGILRKQEARGTSTPSGKKAKIKISTPRGEVLVEKELTISEFGTFSLDVAVPKTAELGSYEAEVKVDQNKDNDNANAAYESFEVAEYKPSEFKVSVESNQKSYIRGDKLQCISRGDYLFGAPMAKAHVRATVTRGVTGYSPPGTENYSTSDTTFVGDGDEINSRAGQFQTSEGELDEKGSSPIETTLVMPGQISPENVTCDAEIMDLSRQTVAGSTTAVVHPGEFYIALKSGAEEFAKEGDDLEPVFMTVDPAGKKVAGIPVEVELIHRSWVSTQEAARGASRHTVSRPTDTVLGQCSATTGQNPVSCKIKVTKSGYFILRAKSKDRRGNPLSSSTYVYALGNGEVSWGESDDQSLGLNSDKKSYEVGQTAKILVKSPYPSAEALVTVERSGFYSQQKVHLTGSMPTITVPITDEMRPNAYVSVVMVRGRSKAAPAQWDSPDVGAPAFRIGYLNLSINPEARRLAVELKTDKKDYRPGEKATVEVDVKDRAGKGTLSEITLYAVDEGVLMMTGYKTPDPIPVFTQARPLQVGFTESRSELAKLTLSPLQGSVGEDKGLEGGGGGAVRRNFEQSAYFNPSLVTDENGHAKVTFPLPESLTTYRIMAVATAKDDRFGFKDSQVTTSRPLMARPAFPRLMRAGDEISAGVVVTAKALPKSRIDIRISAEGVQLVGEASQSIELATGESKEVRFPMRANTVGNAKFKFSIAGGGETDAVEFTKPVIAPLVMESVALYGETSTAAGEQLGDLNAMRNDVGNLDVSVASTALVGLGGSVEHLLEYPYLCTEQLTSRLVPLLPLRSLAKDFQLTMPANTDTLINNTVAEILKRQRGDGSIGLWPDSREPSPWVTAYALWGLGHASRAGATVPKSAIENATRYVRESLEKWASIQYGYESAAFILDVLAENGAPDPGYMSRLYESREKLPIFAKAYLAHAMAIGKGDPKSLAELVRDLEAHLRIEGNQAVIAENLGSRYAVLMDSNTRTTALVLRAFLAANPNHASAARIVRGLLHARKGGQWNNTQESAYALLSLDEFRKAQEKDVPNFIAQAWIGSDQILDAPLTGHSTKAVHALIPTSKIMEAKGSTLAFQLGGAKEGTLYYEARLRYSRKEMPQTSLDRGFFVQKTMRIVRPEAIATALRTVPDSVAYPTAKGGDLVLVDLLIVSPQPQTYVVIDDPLPAGLEAVNSRFATTSASLNIPQDSSDDDNNDDSDEEREDRSARGSVELSSWYRQEIRDDRVLYFVDHMAEGLYHYRYLTRATTIGTFVLPPTRAEAMYQPEIFGRTSGAIFRITDR